MLYRAHCMFRIDIHAANRITMTVHRSRLLVFVNVGRRIMLEPLKARRTTEIERFAIVLVRSGCGRWIDGHPAHRVNMFR